MRERTYEYLNNPRGALQFLPYATGPFTVQKKTDPRWNTVNIEAQTKYSEFNPVTNFREDAFILVSGTLNLINVLIDKNKKGPISTMVFLDKSARNGAFLFNVAWELLKEKGYRLPQKPNIRFINVGRHEDAKHHDERAKTELQAIYRPEDFSGNVLIVDEVVASGKSLRRAGETIMQAGYHSRSLEGIAQFQYAPSWYSADSAKGVIDVNVSDSVRRDMIDMKPEEKTSILHGIRTIGWQEFIDVSENADRRNEFLRTITDQTKKDEVNKAIQALHDFTHQHNIHNVDEVIRYVAARGGFLALSPPMEQKIATRQYREALKLIMERAIDQGLVKKRNKLDAVAQNSISSARKILESIRKS